MKDEKKNTQEISNIDAVLSFGAVGLVLLIWAFSLGKVSIDIASLVQWFKYGVLAVAIIGGMFYLLYLCSKQSASPNSGSWLVPWIVIAILFFLVWPQVAAKIGLEFTSILPF